jgi:hypothetical protein
MLSVSNKHTMELPNKMKNCRTYSDTPFSTRPADVPVAPPRLLYSRKEVAYQLSLSLRAIAYMIASGDPKTKRIGGRVMIARAELLRQAALDDRHPIVSKKSRQSAALATTPSPKAA